jgi:hypothetical protein
MRVKTSGCQHRVPNCGRSLTLNRQTAQSELDLANAVRQLELGVPRSRGRSDAAFYYRKRPHSSLDACPPDRAYFDSLPLVAAA